MNINFSVYYILQYEVCSVLMGVWLGFGEHEQHQGRGTGHHYSNDLMYSTPLGLACGLGPPTSGLRLAVEGPPEGPHPLLK
jgi:hypothetical protein